MHGTVSALLPNHNHGSFIPHAIRGLAGQTHPPAEIIVIDDASTDDSIAVIEELAREIPSLRLICNRTNLGAMAALNRGFSEARGDYVYLASADDFAHPALFETLAGLLEMYPDAGLACGDTRCIDPRGQTVGFRPIARPIWRAGYVTPEETIKCLRAIDHWILGGASLVRTRAFRDIGGLDERLGAFADAYALRRIAVRHGFCYAPILVADWRIIATSISHSVTSDAGKCLQLIRDARKAISADPHFPEWYGPLYERRLRFALSRHAMRVRPHNASVLNALNGTGIFGRALLTSLERLPATPARIAAIVLLTLRYRPTSLTRVAATRLLRYFERQDL